VIRKLTVLAALLPSAAFAHGGEAFHMHPHVDSPVWAVLAGVATVAAALLWLVRGRS
jgi:mannose-6-phosphate isomerase-like protein (cupin superfamily)